MVSPAQTAVFRRVRFQPVLELKAGEG